MKMYNWRLTIEKKPLGLILARTKNEKLISLYSCCKEIDKGLRDLKPGDKIMALGAKCFRHSYTEAHN